MYWGISLRVKKIMAAPVARQVEIRCKTDDTAQAGDLFFLTIFNKEDQEDADTIHLCYIDVYDGETYRGVANRFRKVVRAESQARIAGEEDEEDKAVYEDMTESLLRHMEIPKCWNFRIDLPNGNTKSKALNRDQECTYDILTIQVDMNGEFDDNVYWVQEPEQATRAIGNSQIAWVKNTLRKIFQKRRRRAGR